MNIFMLMTLTLFAHVSFASEKKACVLENRFQLMGQNFDIKDCAENAGELPAHFLKMCESFSRSATSLGAPPAKISYQQKCPEKPQATCYSYARKKIVFHYYKRDEASLKDSKVSCETMGGRWKK